MSIRELQNPAVANSLGLATLADITASGVASLEGLTGAITLSSPDASIVIGGSGNDIELTTAGGSGVASLEGLTGAVTLSSPDASISINTAGNDITLQAVIPIAPVASVGGKTGAVTFATGSGIAINYGSTNADPITIENAGVLSVSPGTGVSVSTASGVATVSSVSRQYTLSGTTINGAITYNQTLGVNWTSNTWYLVNTTVIKVPPNWAAGQSVAFDGYQYLNWNNPTFSFFAIYYNTSILPAIADQSLIGEYNSLVPSTGTITNSISGGREGQAYLPMNLTIPPTNIVSGGTISIKVYGLVASALINLVSNPLIDARVSIVYP